MKRKLSFLLTIVLLLLANLLIAFASDGLAVHFIDVGQADACLITCDEHAMMIDGGNSSDSQLIYSYLKNQKISSLDYIVASHDDADHVGGLSAAVTYAGSNIGQVFSPNTDSEKKCFQTFKRKLSENGKSITVPSSGSTWQLGDSTFQILSSSESGTEANIVLRLTYGTTSFLFMGDANEALEKAILSSGFPVESTVLKVAHHGSKTSTGYQFLRAVNPSESVITVGKENSYGHPTDEVLSRLRDQGSSVFRTDNNGTIIFTSDGTNLSYSTQKTWDQQENLKAPVSADTTRSLQNGAKQQAVTNAATSQSSTYVLNTNTKKFHFPDCGSAKQIKEKNKKIVEDTRDHIISQGYAPCKNCNP